VPQVSPVPLTQYRLNGSVMYLTKILSAYLLVVAPLVGAQTISEKAEKDEIIFGNHNDPEMHKAFARAAKTLPGFLKLAANPKPGTSGYALKVGISDGRNTEYFWFGSIIRDGSSFTGILDNEPRLVMIHKNGDRVNFKERQIIDWTYVDEINKKMMGNFTTCALLLKEPPAQAARFKQQYGLSCEE
jgi:uncharacterized protein YegJ (DUF2314 family)